MALVHQRTEEGKDPAGHLAGRASLARNAAIAALGVALGALPWVANQWPAILTLDTVDQLWQAFAQKRVQTHHSVLMTSLLRLLAGRLDLYVLLQVLLFSLALGFAISGGLTAFGRFPGPRRWWIPAALGFAAGAFPSIGTMFNRIVKDVPFTGVLLVALTCAALILSRKERGPALAFLAGLAAGALPWFRHDGVVAALLTITLVQLVGGPGWTWRISHLGGAVLAVGCQLGVHRALDAEVREITRAHYSVTFVADIGQAVHDGVPLTAADRAFIGLFTSEEALRDRWQDRVEDSYFVLPPPVVDLGWLANHPVAFFRGWVGFAARHPRAVLRRRVKFAARVAGRPPLWVFEGSCKQQPYAEWCGGPRGGTAMFLARSERFLPTHYLFWAAVWPGAVLLGLLAASIRGKDLPLTTFCVVPLAQLGVLAVAAPTPTFRYVFYVFPVMYVAALAFWTARRGAAPV